MNLEGYVHTQQHDGPAHAEGWPFPAWKIAGGLGWHFRGIGVPGYDVPVATPEKWLVVGGQSGTINDKGWQINLAQPNASAQTPAFSVEAKNGPWLRLNWWAGGLEGANPYVEWTTADQPQFSPDRRAYFTPATLAGQTQATLPMGPKRAEQLVAAVVEHRTMIPVYRIPGWKGVVTGLRICFNNPAAAQVVIKSFHFMAALSTLPQAATQSR